MALTPAQQDFLHETAKELAAAPAVGGERGRIMERAAATLGKSKKSVYALLKKHTGWSSGRKTRADKGETCVDRELALAVGGLSHLSERQTGKRITSIKAARERLAANGLGIVNPETGEVIMPSASTLSRAMRRYACHPDQLGAARPATELRSLHPNHTWEIDASVCVMYRLKGGGVRLLDEKIYNKDKPGKLVEIAGQRVVRYIVADHFSDAFYLRYEQAKGEDAQGVIRTLVEAISDRGERDPLHGVPVQLLMDKGSGNLSSLVRDFLDNLGVIPLTHEAGNPRAKGTVECLQNLVEKGFESRLRFMETPSIEELQRQADAWRRHFNAHAVLTRAGRPRNNLWIGITDGQLKTVDRSVLEAIAHWQDVRRKIDGKFRISVDTRACGVHEYDLRELGYHGLCVGDSVVVRLNPFRAPAITVIKELPSGEELRFEVRPIEKDAAGRDITAPVIGESFRRAPDTPAETALKEIKMRAYGTDSLEEAEKAHKARNRVPYAGLDIMADVKEAPQYLRRKGEALPVDTPQAAPMPLSHAQAAQRLKALCGEVWSSDPAACMALVRKRFPVQVPEGALEELAGAIQERFAPRPATVIRFEGGRACAN